MDEQVLRLIARGPRLQTLQFINSAEMNTAAGYGVMFELRPRLFLARALTNIGALDVRRQRLVLVACRRFMDPATCPLWPAHRLLLNPETTAEAARLVAVMPTAHRVAMLPTLAQVCAVGNCHAAIDIVHDLSEQAEYACRVASAVHSSLYCPYMRTLGAPTLWRLVAYLRENNAVFALSRLLRDDPARAIACGAWTHLLVAQCRGAVTFSAWMHLMDLPGGLHESIYRMYVDGTPLHHLGCAQKLEPEATRMLCERWPDTVGREAKWLRRRCVIMCAGRPVQATARLWRGIANMPCLLRLVTSFV